MKYLKLGCLFLLFCSYAFSETFKTQIHSIEKGERGEPHLIMFSDGHVGFIESDGVLVLEAIKKNLESEDTVEVILDDRHQIVSISAVSSAFEEINISPNLPEELMSYEPSIINSSRAYQVFRSMRRDYQNFSQCYNRAHIWTYEAFTSSALKSNKLFLFFTSRYIRKFNYKWWFHVTPMVYVGGTDQSFWRTLDRRYTSGPLTLRTWTNIFMLNNAYCPVVYNWSDYRYHQQERDCYLIPTSMYFWQPRDISYKERTGYEKSKYYMSEVNHAYWEAF
jgi:hypothetical protein